MSDFFIPTQNKDDYWTKKQQETQTTLSQQNTQNDYWKPKTEALQQQKEERLANYNRYGVDVPDEYYEQFNKIISQTEDPAQAQEEAYRIGSAIKYSQMYGMTLDEAYSKVDALNEANFTDLQDQKGRFEALSDMFNLGTNNVKLGQLGQQLMVANQTGDTELAQNLMAQIDAINQQNVLMQDNTPRSWVMQALEAGAQSLPFTGYVAAAGLFGNFIAPAVGTGAAFAASSYLSAGQEYLDMLANGASHQTASLVASISGGIQGIIEANLGITKGIVKGTAKLMGKEAAEKAAKVSLEEITKKVAKRFHWGAGKKVLVNYLEQYGKNVLGEGVEEFLQEITSILGQEAAAAMDGYDIPDDDFKSLVNQTTEAFKGGILGALALGFVPAGINAKADIKEYRTVRELAENIESDEMFEKAVEDSKLFEGMSDDYKKEVIHQIKDTARNRMEAEATQNAKEIAETTDYAEGAEERKTTLDENGEEITEEAEPVVREESGKLMYSDDENVNDDGTVSGTFRAGDKTKSENNRYGYISYTADENNKTVTIDDFKMAPGREGLRGEVYDEFAQKYAGYNIEWNATGSLGEQIKESLVENNPAGSVKGLNYYADQNAVADAGTRAKVAAEVKKNIHNVTRSVDADGNVTYSRTELSNKQVASAVALLEAAAKRTGMNLTEYVNKTFGNQIFGSQEDFAQSAAAQGDTATGKAGGVNQGVAQSGWQQYGQQIKAVIYAGENADFSTWAHELAHIFQNQLEGDLKAQAEKAFGVIDGDWTHSKYTFKDGHVDSAAEAFAYGFQDWLKTGQAESEEMKNIFQKFAEFLVRAFNSLKDFINLTPEIKDVYNQLLSGDDSLLKAAERAVEAEDRSYHAQMQQNARNAENERKAQAEQEKKQAEAEREEASETTDFTEETAETTPEQAEAQLQEATNETTESNNAIDNALENTNLTDEQKDEVAEVLKDPDTTVVEKAEASTEAASSAYDDAQMPFDLFQTEQGQKLLYQLAGEKSIQRMAESEEKERILADLDAAKLLNDRYKSMDANTKASRIRRMTGWEMDATGRWKYETDDSVNRIKTEVFKNNPDLLTDKSAATLMNLSDILEAPELYKVFPYMKNVRVSFYSDPNAFRAVLTPQGIKVNTRYLQGMDGEKGLKGVLAHEIQHVIQAMEYAESTGLQGHDIEQLYNDMMDAMQAAGERKYDYDLTSLQQGLDAYMQDEGEIEARNVARRVLMNADQRRMNTLASTEDVQRNNILFQAAEADIKEIETQEDYIRNEYEGTDQWMKAPNGEPTKLTEKQWCQVRTTNFKRWFGNWELANKIFNVVKTGRADFNNKADAMAWAEKNIIGLMGNEDTGGKGEINISNKSVDEMLNLNQRTKSSSNEVHYAALTKLREIIHDSEIVDAHPDYNKDKNEKRTPLAGINKDVNIDVLYGALSFEGDIYRVKTTIKRFIDENAKSKAYAYDVQKIEVLPGIADNSNNATVSKGSTTITGNILLQGVRKVNQKTGGDGELALDDYSKVLDENGEPLVVFHGSNQWFQVFNEGETNKSNVNTPDNTIFTNDNKEIASSFQNYYGGAVNDVILDKDSPLHRKYDWGTYRAGGVYSLFMNLRNPKVLDYKGQTWKAEGMNINDEVAKAKQEGYDGVIAKNIIDVGFTDVTPPASNDYIAFNNTDVKSATDNNGNFDESNPNILFQIAGEIGAQNLDDADTQEGVSRMQNLAIAKEMEKAGKDAQTIRLATSWEKGTDGKWRYELDDSNIKISNHYYPEQYFYNKYPRLKELEDKLAKDITAYDNFTEEERADYDYYSGQLSKLIRSHIDFEGGKETWIEPASLDDVIYAPELFTAYPQLAKIKFIVKKLEPGLMGQYDGTTIVLDEMAPKSTLLHEIQHAIQDIEGFAKGGSDTQFEEISADNIRDKLKELNNKMTDWMIEHIPTEEWIAKDKELLAKGLSSEEYRQARIEAIAQYDESGEYQKFVDEVDELNDRIQEIEENALEGQVEIDDRLYEDAFEAYRSLAGEVESRNVQTRMNFTPEERLNTLLSATEDVAPEDKIILFQTAYHGSGADFDKFDTEHYGLSGEGSMSFGYGTYVTDSEDIARDYADRQVSQKYVDVDDAYGVLKTNIIATIRHETELKGFEKALQERKEYLQRRVEDPQGLYTEEQKENSKKLLEELNNLTEADIHNRHLYTVEIPDNGYLQWDKTTPKNIREHIANGLYEKLIQEDYKGAEKELKQELKPIIETPLNGKEMYDNLWTYLGSDKEASQFLKSIGYNGIKYPAGTNYGNGNGAYNYVIFNDEDAKIVNHMFFQTEAELQDEAKGFDSWQEFQEYCEVMHSLDDVSPIPSDADAQWYQSFWETSRGLETEQQKNEQEVQERVKKEGTIPGAIDAYFTTMIRSQPEILDNFLKELAYIDAVDFDSEEWRGAADESDAAERERIEKLKDFMSYTLSDYNWQSAMKRVQSGNEISEGQRKRLIGEIADSFKTRDFRALYAEVMGDEQYAVDEEDTTAAQLQKKLSKYSKRYYDIAKPGDDLTRMSPEKRKRIAEQMQNADMAAKIKSGSLKLDDELDAYIKSLDNQIKEKQKLYDDLEKETKADYQRIADAEQRKLLKLHDELLIAQSKIKKSDAETQRKIKKGLKITEKYRKASQNLHASYDEIFRKFNDLKSSIQITAEVQAALDRQEQVAGIKDDINNRQKEKNLTAEVKKMRIQLVKRTMRRVPFNRIDYENARTVIAIQRMLEPNLLGGVNRFIGIDSPFLRGVISQVVTDTEYKEKLLNYLKKANKSSQAFVDFVNKLENLKSVKDFDSWTAKERKYAIKHLPKENWVRDLNLEQLAKEREESIDLDIDTKEKQTPKINPKTGRVMTNKDGDIIYETTFVLDASDELKKLVQDAVGTDMFNMIQNQPFAEWTTEDLERLAKRIDELYTEGREMFAAKAEARRRENDAIRKRIEDAIKETGIVINDDDTSEEKARKQEKINKILGLKGGLAGTEAGKQTGMKAKLDRLIHGYWDANVLRVGRILDNQSEGVNVQMLYRREDDCFNAKTRSIMQRGETIKKIMSDNKITEESLAKTVAVPQLKTEFTVDELLYFLAADEDNEIDPSKVSTAVDPLDMNDDYAATSRNAVMFGNMMSDTISQEQKEAWVAQDKAMQEAIDNGTLTPEQQQLDAIGMLEKKPGTKAYITECHIRWAAALGAANQFIAEHPEYKALLEAIQADYAQQYERMNEVSINEFNMPVHRVKAYVPLVRRESNGDTNVNQVKEDLLGTFGAEAGKQWVNKGMTQRRVNISPLNQKPVQTGLFRTWADSVERTEHFIAYAPYVRQLNAVYKSRDAAYTRRFMEARYGKPMLEYIDSYINEVANPNANKIREKGSELLHMLRGKTAPAYLGWKFSAIVKQGLTSPWPYMQFVNPAEYLAACFKCINGGYDAVKSKSVYMASRVMDPMNELVDEMADQAKNKVDRAWSNFAKKGMAGLEWIDWTCVAPGWLACYEKEYNRLQNMSEAAYEQKKAELTEKNMQADISTGEWMSAEQIEAQARQELEADIESAAVRYADDCTRQCQPSSRVTDLSPLFKNSSEAMKAFLQFQTSLNVIWQNIRYDIPYAVRQKQFKRIAGTVCGYVFAGIFMNSVMEGVTSGADDDDKKAQQALRNLIFYSTTQFTDAIPMIGSDITNSMDQIITGKRGFMNSGTDMTPSATKIMSAFQKATKGDWKKAAALSAEGIGLFMGAPVSGTKEINKLLGKPLDEGDVDLLKGLTDVYGIARDFIEE